MRAFAAIGTALAERFAGEALAGVRDAERAVDESFQRDRRFTKLGEFAERSFAGDDDAFDAEPFHKRDACRRGDGHLRRGVDFHAEPEFLRQHGQSQILDEHRVHAGGVKRDELAFGRRQLVGEDQDVERGITADVVVVEKLHERRQLVVSEIIGALPGIELLETEVDGIRTVGDGRAGAVQITGGCEEFGFHAAATA